MPVVRINIPSKAPIPDLWDDIQPDFTMPSPRKYQGEALSVIKWCIENDEFDNIVIQAPTGIGKSAIAMTIQKWFQSTYLLTPNLGLTQQYRRDYGNILKEVKGRSNFPCWVREGTAAGAPCWSNRKPCPHTKKEDACPYYEQKHEAAEARLTLSNPAYLFRVIKGDPNFGQRDLAIVDEAHEIEPFLMGFLDTRITMAEWEVVHGRTVNFPMHYHPADWVEPIKAFHKASCDLLEAADAMQDEKAVERYRTLVGKTSVLVDLLKNPNQVVIENTTEGKQRILKVRPTRVGRFASEQLDAISRRRILMSATILDVDTFLDNLGLADQRNLYVNITDSPFPSDNLKIHYASCGPMSYSKRDNSIKKQVKAISGIMERFPHKRGVILPHSHYIRKALVEGLIEAGHESRIITHGSDSRGREVAIKKFMESPDDDLVLISPYVVQGFDFKGKLAEWLVISKVPFLPIKGDPVIEQRMQEDEQSWRQKYENTPDCPYEPPNKYSNNLCSSFSCPKPCQSWYQLQTALKLVQGAGRVVRTPTDKGHLFILDGSWQRFARQNSHLLPAWFRGAIQEPPQWLKRHLI